MKKKKKIKKKCARYEWAMPMKMMPMKIPQIYKANQIIRSLGKEGRCEGS